MSTQLPPASRRLRFGIVGGGGGGFIGPIHLLAARMDNRYDLLAAAPSSRPDVAANAGREWFLAPERVYSDYREMAVAEAGRRDGIEVVAITTPNHLHYEVAHAFLDVGINVICDKPLTTTLAQARDLVARTRETRVQFFVTHAFAAYPMVRQARSMVHDGALGRVRLVHVEFMQDWLTDPIDASGDRHAAWRTDPERSGLGGAIADIGTHAYHLARFVSCQDIVLLSAALYTVVPGRRLDDNAHLRVSFENGAKGTIILSQTAPGNECGLRIRVYGEKAGLEWHQEEPNYLRFAPLGEATTILGRAERGLAQDAQRMTRVPRGHPEGYLEAFANLYSEAAVAIEAQRLGIPVPIPIGCAGVEDGAAGVSFIEAAIQSNKADGTWIDPRFNAEAERTQEESLLTVTHL